MSDKKPANKPPAATPLRPVAAEGETGQHRAVQRAQPKKRHYGLAAFFFLVVVVPIAATFAYLYFVANDQYASRASFSVFREEDTSPVSLLGGLTNLSTGTDDSEILYEYMNSQNIVRVVDEKLDLKKVYAQTYKSDPIFSLAPDASIEDKLDYWTRMAKVRINPSTKIVSVEVRAFNPEDAHKITELILTQGSLLIDELRKISQEDTIKEARREREEASARLKETRVAIAGFRRTSKIIDPAAEFSSQMGVLNELQQQLVDAMIQLDLLSGYAKAGDPRIEPAQRRIDAIRSRIAEERAKVSSEQVIEESGPLVSVFSEYEELLVEQEFAEQAYIAALASYDTALLEARRKSRYLAVHIYPTLAETPEYPQRFVTGIVISVFALLLWMLSALVFYSLRDRR